MLNSSIHHVTVLGATGSVGQNTLDVIARHPDRFKVFALTAAKQADVLFAQCMAFSPTLAVMIEPTAAKQLADRLKAEGSKTQVLCGAQALIDVVTHPTVTSVMAAIVGAAGLAPCLAAARAGKRLLLANKEALVVGGRLFMQAVHDGNAKLLPIDSEHSAIFQSLPEDARTWAQRVDKLILTASGGPFLKRDPATFASITPQEACAHPQWVMGRKISVDSATMMNKALEVIEAHYLFGLPASQIEVVIHPQSIVHSMVQYKDHSIVAQLGNADMRVPIAYGLSWPDRVTSGAKALDFTQLAALQFESITTPAQQQRFACLGLAYQALAAPEGACAVLNAANEVAVDAFLHGQLTFDRIHVVNTAVLNGYAPASPQSLDDLLHIDQAARALALQSVQKYSF